MRRLLATLLALPLILAGALAAAIAFGGPAEPAPMASINVSFKDVDFSDLPPPRRDVRARDGTALVYRLYPAAGVGAPRGSVVLVHGSSARGSSMHVLAKAYAQAGWQAYALDMRGHGDTGPRGVIDYLGQLDDDLQDFMTQTRPPRPATLAGFSAGGGFALRFAAGPTQHLFDRYLLLSPFISQDAATYRPDSGGWVQVGLPRIVALSVLDRAGLTWFQDLPVTRFALDQAARPLLTPQYSYALALNFRPRLDYRAEIQAAGQPMRVVAGQADEAFRADRFAQVFKEAGREVAVDVLPGIDHVGLTLESRAVAAVVAATGR